MHPWVSFEDGTRHLGLPVRPGGRKCVWVYTHSSRRPLIGRQASEILIDVIIGVYAWVSNWMI